MYTATIRQYATDDRRVGTLADADGTGEVGLGAGEAGRRLAVRFALRVREGIAETVRFQVFGCGFTIAACAAAAELAEGRPLTEVGAIAPPAIAAALGGLPEERRYCADLAAQALGAAVTSARGGSAPVAGTLAAEDDHAPRGSAEDPRYRLLIDSPNPAQRPEEDRHLFACLLAIAARESADPATALGLAADDFTRLVAALFPAVSPRDLIDPHRPRPEPPPVNGSVRNLLLGYVPADDDGAPLPLSRWLALVLATRAAHPGHLWVALGLFQRPQLTAAIRRHLPALAAANDRGMRWKRFFFKSVCDLSGGHLCKAPDCGVCSDYALCFAPE